VDRVGVGEDVVGRLPVGVLVGITEACQPKRRAVSQRSAKAGRSGACADRRLDGVDDPGRIVSEQLSGERDVLRPAMHASASSEQFQQLARCFVTQRDEIDRLTPGGRLLGATGRYHLADDSRQQSRRMFPADQVEAFERFVDEVERVPAVGKDPFRLGREQRIGEHTRREPGGNRREQGALCGLAMAHVCPMPQPAFVYVSAAPLFGRRRRFHPSMAGVGPDIGPHTDWSIRKRPSSRWSPRC